MNVLLISQRCFIIHLLVVSCTLCLLPLTWGYQDTRLDYTLKNDNQFSPQKTKPTYNETSKTDEISKHHRNVENSVIEGQETTSHSSEVQTPSSENPQDPRRESSKIYPSVESNSEDTDGTEMVQVSEQLSTDERDSRQQSVFSDKQEYDTDKKTLGESKFNDKQAPYSDEKYRQEEMDEARLETGGEDKDEILRRTPNNNLIAAAKRQNFIRTRSSQRRHGEMELPHTDDSGFHSISNLHDQRKDSTVGKGVGFLPISGNGPRLGNEYRNGINTAKVSPADQHSKELTRVPVAIHDSRTPRYIGVTDREHRKNVDLAPLFDNYGSLRLIETPAETKEHYLEESQRMPQVDSTSREFEDWQGSLDEKNDAFYKHPDTLDLPVDAEVSMRGAGWTTFDVPMERQGGNEFQFSPLEDRQTSDSLNSEYRKYFGELDDSIAFEMPELHVNCWLQSMMATTWGFSPSCNADGSYGPKQCHEKRCWCVDSNGQKIRHHGGKNGDGFYFGLQGLTLYCAEN